MYAYWHLLIPLSLVSSATYDFAWDARQLNYTCDGLKEQTGKEWSINGDFCVHFSDDRYSWSGARDACTQPSFSSSVALGELSWLQLRLLPQSTTQQAPLRYWTALKFNDATSLLDGPVSTSIYSPSWADAEPTALEDACVAIDLSQTTRKLRGWYFETCTTGLPVICQTFACIDDEFRCFDNTRCIPRTAVNDGFEDCLDGSDEASSSLKSVAASLNVSRASRLGSSSIELQSTLRPRQDDIEFTCPFPQDLKQVYVIEFTGYAVGDALKWRCNSGWAPRDEQYSTCVTGEGWLPLVQCNQLNCNEPETVNLTALSGTFHGDRAHYSTPASAINSQLTRVAVCDEGIWVYMNDELNDICLGVSFEFGHFVKDKYIIGETMEFTCETDFFPTRMPSTCQAGYSIPSCNPDPVGPGTCDGTPHTGPPQFQRDWCSCKDGGVQLGGECQGYTESCTAEQDTCNVGRTCQRNETAGEDYHCACPPGSCLYPFDDCAQHAFLPIGSVDKDVGECATIRCQIDDLKRTIPGNCQVTAYGSADASVDMRLGSTDVICSHNAGGGEKVQTRHSVKCLEGGHWEETEFNKMCNATREVNYVLDQYSPFQVATVYYRSMSTVQMNIRCNGNGEWIGEVPTENCTNGVLQQDYNLVRCVCEDGFFGTDCGSRCDQGFLKDDGKCGCNDGYIGDHCEIAICPDKVPPKEANGEKVSLVFILDYYENSFDALITNKNTGLLSSIQQLIRDISYYDGQFIGDIVLIIYGMSSDPSDIKTKTFAWTDVGDFVTELHIITSTPISFCNYGLQTVLSESSQTLKNLPRGSIVNILTVQPMNTLDDYLLDIFVSNGLIVNIISDSTYSIAGCSSEGGDYGNYQRLAKLTGGYFLDGLSAAAFSTIIPRLYKSSLVLIPAVTTGDTNTMSPFVLDAGAQTIMVHSFNADLAPSATPTSPNPAPAFEVLSMKDYFRIVFNSPAFPWKTLPMMEGYYFQGIGEQNWAGAISGCETLGGTVVDFDNVCTLGEPSYWLPIRRNSGGDWEATFRGTKLPVLDTNFGSPPIDGYDCVAINCGSADYKWYAASCDDPFEVMCQKPLFDDQKSAPLPEDQIRPGPDWEMSLSDPFDGKTSYSLRVQSSAIAFDHMLTDSNNDPVTQIASGKTQVRLATSSANDLQDATRVQLIAESEITRSSIRKTSCLTFPTSSDPLFCRSSGDVTVQVLNKDGAAMRSFIARCSYSYSFPTPVDCASTGCILENTGFCYIDQSHQFKCNCLTGFSGDFCEYQQKDEAFCAYMTALNDVATDSVIMSGGCGCSPDMSACSYTRGDGCDSRCSPDSKCMFIDVDQDPFSTTKPTTTMLLAPKAVAACVCDPLFEGEFCDRKVATDCTGKPCKNGAECVDLVDPTGILCICPAGYTGQFCDISMGLCTEKTCENGGTCYNLDPLSTFCMCHNGYAGDRCERMLNLGCFNGGRATANGDCDCLNPSWEGQYCTLLKDPMPLAICDCADGSECVYDEKEGVAQKSCKCQDNYVGDKCEILQSPCSLSPCGPHGACIEGANAREYKCKCDEDYGGDLCDVFVGGDGCDADTCLNGGTCDKGVCECPSTFTGTHCQTAVPCSANGADYCKNRGKCSEVNEKPVCQCPVKYTGKQCEKETTKTFNIKFSPLTQQLLFDMQNVDPIFSVCAWVRGTPPRPTADTEMPIFEIEFGTDKLRVTTKKATVRGQSLGPLDLRMQVWQQFCVRCNSVKCDAFANGASLGVNLFGGFSHSSKTLTLAPAPAKGETQLNAEISRFSIYNRAISDKEVGEFTFNCASTVGSDQTVEYVWGEILNAVQPPSALVSPGLCETSTCFPGSCKEKNDKSPPVATSCPESWTETSSRPKSLFWDGPVFEDDQDVVSVDSNYRSGDIFIWGEHHVVYTATDASGNTGRCEFDIYFAPNACKQPVFTAALKGKIQYEDTFDGESGSYSMASVQCEDPRFPQDGPKFYVCDYLGQWRRSYYSPVFVPPSCGRVSEALQTLDGSVIFNTANYNCEENREKIREAIDKVLSNVCPNGEDGCAVVTISDCPTTNDKVARADDEEPALSYTITLVNDDEDADIYESVQSEINKIDGATADAEPPAFTCSEETPLRFESGGDTLCAEVPPGYFYNSQANTKVVCPINQYQDQSNGDSCKQCPDETITESEGATKVADCYQDCSPGQWCNFDKTGAIGASGAFSNCCQDCAIGSYESNTGSKQCTNCRDGMTTHNAGAKDAGECYWKCTLGQEVNADTGDCRDCEQGKYKATDQAGQCLSCASGLTTAGSKSTSAADCSVLYCPPNTYVNPSQKGSIDPTSFKLADFCLPCEKGTWQQKYNQTACVACPNTPEINTPDFPSTCRLENECSPDLANCGEGLKCIKWPDNNYYHCVDNHDENETGGGSLAWWQIVLIVAGSCLGVAIIIAIAVIVAMRCFNVGKKVEKDTDSLSHQRRATIDNYGSTVPDKEETHYDDLPTPMIELPPVHIDSAYVYNRTLPVPPNTPAAPPIEYQRQVPLVPSTAVVRMRKRMSNASVNRHSREQSRPFSTDTIGSVPSIRDPAGRSSGNYYVPSVTIRSNSESSLDSFSVGSVSSRQFDLQPRQRPDSTQIVHALIDALDEDRFRGGWDKESSIL